MGERELDKGNRMHNFKGVSKCVVDGDDITTVDWRGRASNPNKHGGMRAASFVLGLQAFEIMAIAAVGNNLITYVINEMHFSLSRSANIVTNFVGTVFILALLGGYLSDSYLGCFWTMLIFGFVELSGFILLSVQAHLPQLKPPRCNMLTDGDHCVEAKGVKALIFFVALYLVALGSGCVKPNMIAHGADQFNQNNQKQSKKLSTYFNAAYFAFSMGELVALTVLVWVQTHSGMDVGFGVSAAAMAMGLISLVSGTLYYRNKPPQGSIFTPIAQVFVAAILKRKQILRHGNQNHVAYMSTSSDSATNLFHTQRFSQSFVIFAISPENETSACNAVHETDYDSDGRVKSESNNYQLTTLRFLDKACIKIQDGNSTNESPWRLCTVTQVEQVKILISVIPIFACTIVFNTILAQLQTFSVQQGSAMNTQVTKSFHIPPASLQSIPYIVLIVVVPLYETSFVPFARKITGRETGITPLQRIGTGLFLATFSMVSAAIMEKKRRDAAIESNKVLSIFWITPQFLIFGISEMLTAVGLIEFFYKQSLKGMQTFFTAITYCSYSFGFYLSSLLVSLVNNITSTSSNRGWLSENDLNKDRLDLFYWLLTVLSFLNFLNYLFWARWYSYNPSIASTVQNLPHENFNSVKYIGEDNIP